MTETPRRQLQRSKPKGKPKVAVEKYNAVVRAAEIVHIALVRMDFDMRPLALNLNRAELDFSYNGEVTQQDLGEDGTASAIFSWNVTAAKRAGSDSEQPNKEDEDAGAVLTISADWIAIFAGLSDKQDEAIKAFVERVGRMATYPYFRALVSQLSWASGASLPLMPIIRP